VLFIDLDDFKVINDTKGHETGDELLAGVGERLRRLVARDDTVARLGGDEFAILIEGAGQPADIESIAGRIIAAMAEPLDIRGELLTPNMSIGVAVSTDAADPTDLLRQADLALYVAKGSGKNQFRRYQSSLHTALLQRLELRAALEKSVTEGGFLLHYQPIVDMKTGVMRGAEALLRWDRPGYGFVPPSQFIDVAEDSGLIVPIGNWVLRKALATAAEWYRTGRPDPIPYVSVNVSARQFRTPGFVELVREQLDANALPPYLLVLEITESLLLRDAEQVWIDLTALREIGVRIAIDDFGTGYSSLSYLRQVPADILKIDKSFVDDIATQPQQAAVVQAIVSLAHTLNLQVVAEGIENEASHELLTRFGCALGQGYLFARPMSAAQLFQPAAKTELLV
jgi:diguanylate cyclase (GGDEF)-like protein